MPLYDHEFPPLPDRGYDLAIKMLFNYSVASQSDLILREMERETTPARLHEPRTNLTWDQGWVGDPHAAMLLYYLALIRTADMICCLYHLQNAPKMVWLTKTIDNIHFQFLCPHHFGVIKTESTLLKPLKGIVK